MPALYTDPAIVKRVVALYKDGHGPTAIARRVRVSVKTVRKILFPDFAVSERVRLAAVDKVRAPTRRQQPAYIAYQAEAGRSETHKARARRANVKRRAMAKVKPNPP